MSSLQFNAVLVAISNELTRDELEQMKYLCDDIGKRDKEKIDTGLKLFQALTQRNKLGADNTGFLSCLLTHANRQDLSDRLNGYESQAEFTENQPDETERAKLDIATNVIVDNLALWNTWRKLGRKLGVKEVRLESISKKHPTDLEETVRELLKEWRKSQGAQAQAVQLINALRACQFNLTADKVEEELNANGL
ncbi:FAS-associated death domain protein [Centroberyx affinis]|uniref:FAS-associated death domain protein n=1 Tax=Centroberyx affinis TaxID=166261 RepID=UPI003A5BB27A